MAQPLPGYLQQRPAQFLKLCYPASGALGPKGGDLKSTKAKSCGSSPAALYCLEDRPFCYATGSYRSSHAACLRSNSLKNCAELKLCAISGLFLNHLIL